MWIFFFFSIFVPISQATEVEYVCDAAETFRCEGIQKKSDEILKDAKSKNQKVLFLFGSKKCGPCIAWKKYFKEHPADVSMRVVYLPLSYRLGNRSISDEGAVSYCKDLESRFQVMKNFLNSEIASIEACLRKPTMFLVDPNSGFGQEADPSYIKNQAQVKNHLDTLLKSMNKKASVPNLMKSMEPESDEASDSTIAPVN